MVGDAGRKTGSVNWLQAINVTEKACRVRPCVGNGLPENLKIAYLVLIDQSNERLGSIKATDLAMAAIVQLCVLQVEEAA
jgi:hypothetical protein